jgi:RimJ/RimL family protein N-acetyltransferase
MMGVPLYPDLPIPTWKEFCDDYKPHFFNSPGEGKGRDYIIISNGNEEVGTIRYDVLDKKKSSVVLDIWMRATKYCGFGFGGDALNALCDYLHQRYGVTNFVISPSGRNKQAIASYQKCGFKCVSKPSKEIQKKDFGISACADNIIMVKKVSHRPPQQKTIAIIDLYR